jgi:hypothetical protein
VQAYTRGVWLSGERGADLTAEQLLKQQSCLRGLLLRNDFVSVSTPEARRLASQPPS